MHTFAKVWFDFPLPNAIFFTLAFQYDSTLLTQLKPSEASEQAAKQVEGAAFELLPGLTRPGPCEPKFWKNDLPANLFLLCVLPQKCNKFTPAFEHVLRKHTFWHVFQKLRHVCVSYISWYVLGGMSLPCLPIFAWQLGRKQNDIEIIAAFSVKPQPCVILWQHGVFSFTKVCIFLPMVFIRTFTTTLCFYDFCKTVLVKKCTPCQGVVWFSPSKCHIFYTGF